MSVDAAAAPAQQPACGPLLADWIAGFLHAQAARGHTARTRQTRAVHLRRFATWGAAHGVRLGLQVSDTVLLDFQRHLHRARDARGRPAAALSQRGMLSDLRAFGRWCCATGLLTTDPTRSLHLPRIPASLPIDRYTPAQVAALLAAPNLRRPLGVRDRAVLELAAALGLSGRELAALTLAGIEADTGLVMVPPLERGRARQVPAGEAAGRWLRQYVHGARPALLAGRAPCGALLVSQTGQPLAGGDISHLARRHARAAGLPVGNVLGTLKTTLAVTLLEHGCDARYLAALFGHADLQSVRRYQRVHVRGLQAVHRQCHPAERPGPPAVLSEDPQP